MIEERIIQRLSAFFYKKGFKKIYEPYIFKSIGWSFDLVVENRHETIAIEFRKNDQILDIFLDKIKSRKKHARRLSIYVVFEKMPRTSISTSLKTYGIGIIIIQKNRENGVKSLHAT